MRLGFIGAGHMASAIVDGIVSSGLIDASQICAHDPAHGPLAALAERTGIVPMAGNEELIEACETVVLAVKPQVMPSLLEAVGAMIVARRRLTVSIAAGVTLTHLDGWLGPNVPLVRVMPNLNASIGQGMAAVAGNSVATGQQIGGVMQLFAAVGKAIELDERLFPAFTAIAGSSPAWVFLFIEALGRAGLAAGMTKAQARQAAAQAVLGSAALLLSSPAHPWELIDQVSSPGGTTIAGLNTLEERGFSAAVIAAVEATIAREAELAG